MGIQSLARRACRVAFRPLVRAYAVRDNVTLGERVHIGVGTTIDAPRSLVIGSDVYIGKRCTIECDGAIGNGVLIANQAGLIGRHDHDYKTVGVSVRDSPWVGDDEYIHRERLRLVIGDDVWIGFGAIVLTGATVGRGAIVGAGSVVTNSVPPYSIVAGQPAGVIAMRFSASEAALHEAMLSGTDLGDLQGSAIHLPAP